MSTYDLKFVADVTGTAAGLMKVPGMAEAAAAKAALKSVEQKRAELKKIEKLQEDAAKKAASGWGNAFKGLAKVAGFGELTEKAGALSGGMEGAALASGLAVAGVVAVGAAAVGAAAGAVKLTRAAGDAIVQFDRLGMTDIVTDAQREQVTAANDALDTMGAAAGAVTVAIAAGLAPAITSVAEKVVGLELFVGKVIGTFQTGALSIASWTDLLLAAVTGGILPFVDGLMIFHRLVGTNTDEMEGFAASIHKFAEDHAAAAFAVHADTEEQREALAVSTDGARAIEQVAAANEKSTEAYKKHTDAVKKLADAEKERAKTVLAMWDAAVDQAAESRFQAAQDEAAKEVATHQSVLDMWDAANAKYREEQAEKDKQLREKDKQLREEGNALISSGLQDLGNEALALGTQLADQQLAKHTDEIAKLRERRDTFIENQKAQGRVVDASKSEYIKGINDQIKAEKKRAMMAYVAQKSLAIASIIQSAAQMAVVLAANPAFVTATAGVGAVPAALALAGGMAALQSAAVLAAPPPKFAQGGEVQVTAESGEIIANRRAAANPRVRKQIFDANAGIQSGGTDATNVFLDGRLLMKVYKQMKRLAGEAIPPQLENA